MQTLVLMLPTVGAVQQCWAMLSLANVMVGLLLLLLVLVEPRLCKLVMVMELPTVEAAPPCWTVPSLYVIARLLALRSLTNQILAMKLPAADRE
jgi:hypothetical protein